MREENVIADLAGEVYSKENLNYGRARYFKKEKWLTFFQAILNPHIRKKYILNKNPNQTEDIMVNRHPVILTMKYQKKLLKIRKWVSDLDVCLKRLPNI